MGREKTNKYRHKSGYLALAAVLALTGVSISPVMAAQTTFQGVNASSGTQSNANGAGATGTDAATLGTNAKASGDNSIAIGKDANASGLNSVAIQNAIASGANTIAIGNGAKGTNDDSVVMGSGATSNVICSVVIGPGATASGDGNGGAVVIGSDASVTSAATVAIGAASVTVQNGIAIGAQKGYKAVVNGDGGFAVGNSATVGFGAAGAQAIGRQSSVKNNSTGSIALGASSVVDGAHSIAIGGAGDYNSSTSAPDDAASVTAANAVGVGSGTRVTYAGGTALGYKAKSLATNALALGYQAQAPATNGVALGSFSVASRETVTATAPFSNVSLTPSNLLGVVSVGYTDSNGAEVLRQITHVGDGTQATDAVNLRQLQGALNQAMVHYLDINSTNQNTGSNYLNDGATGTDAIALGVSSKATGNYSTAIGQTAIASGVNAIAMGQLITASGDGTIAIGNTLTSTGANNIVMGNKTATTKTISTTNSGVTTSTTYTGTNNIAIGNNVETFSTNVFNVTSAGKNAVALGNSAIVSGDGAVAIGYKATAPVSGSIVIGSGASLKNYTWTNPKNNHTSATQDSIVIGKNAQAMNWRQSNVVIGAYASVTNGDLTNMNRDTGYGIMADETYKSYFGNGGALGSTAVGHDAIATTDAAVALGAAHALAQNSIAIGAWGGSLYGHYTAETRSDGSFAVGNQAIVYENSPGAQAIGRGATVTTNSGGALALGQSALTKGKGTVALGGSPAETPPDGSLPRGDAVIAGANYALAMSSNSQVYSEGGIAIGYGSRVGTGTVSYSTETGYIKVPVDVTQTTEAKNAIAIGRSVSAQASEAIVVGGNSSVVRATGSNADSTVNVVSLGNYNYINTDKTYAIGSEIGALVNRVTSTDSTTGNTVYGDVIRDSNGNATITSQFGTVANSVYLGDRSKVRGGAGVVQDNGVGNLYNYTETNEDSAGKTAYRYNSLQGGYELQSIGTTTAGATGTVEKVVFTVTRGNMTSHIEYRNFQGKTAVGAVSVGAAGSERRIQNLAAGEISATSTDAINGSQLYNLMQSSIETGHYFSINSNYDKDYNTETNPGDSVNWFNDQAQGTQAIAVGTAMARGNNAVSIGSLISVKEGTGTTDAEKNTNAGLASAKSVLVGYKAGTVIGSALNTDANGDTVSTSDVAPVSYDDQNKVGASAIAIGDNTYVPEDKAVAIGSQARGQGASALSLGASTLTTVDNGVALGSNSVADRAGYTASTVAPFSKVNLNGKTLGAVSVGYGSGTTEMLRQLTHVGDGVNATDAVNVRQLQGVYDAGLNFKGTDAVNINRPIASTLNVIGADTNITTASASSTTQSGLDTLKIKLASDLTNINTIKSSTTDTATTPATITLTPGTPASTDSGGNTVPAVAPIVNVNGAKITNVATPTTSTSGLLTTTSGLNNAVTLQDLQTVAKAGLNFQGNDEVNINRSLSQTLTIKGEGVAKSASGSTFLSAPGNIDVVANSDTNGLVVKLNKNLSNITSISSGAADNQSPTTVTLYAGAENGKGTVSVGGARITNVGDPTADGDAVNKKYLTDNISKAQAAATTAVTGTGAALVTKTQSTDGHYTYNVHVDQTTAYVDKDGNKLTKYGNAYYTDAAVAGKTYVNGNWYNSTDIGTDGQPTSSAQPLTGDDVPTSSNVAGTNLVNQANGSTTNTVKLGNITSNLDTTNPTTSTSGLLTTTTGLNNAVTLQDLQTVALAGLNFQGNDGVTVNRALSQTLTVKGDGVDATASQSFVSAAGNINVVADGTSGLMIQMNKALNNITSISSGAGDGQTATTITLTPGTAATPGDDTNPATPAVPGTVDVGGSRVTNVATPVAGTDAVNKDYLDSHVSKAQAAATTVVTGDGAAVITKTQDATDGHFTYNVHVDQTTAFVNSNGDKLVKVGDNYYKAGDVVNGVPNSGASAQTPAGVSMVNPDGTTSPTTLSNVKSALNPGQKLADVTDSKTLNSAANLGDVKNAIGNAVDNINKDISDVKQGISIQTNTGETKKVEFGGTIQVVDGVNTKVSAVTVDADKKLYTYHVDVNGLPMAYVDKDGNQLVKLGDKYYKAGDVVNGAPIEGAQEATVNGVHMVNPDGSTNAPTTMGNVKSAIGGEVGDGVVSDKTGNNTFLNTLRKTDATKVADDKVVTAGDLRNLANSPFFAAGDVKAADANSNSFKRTLGQTINIVGGVTDTTKLADNNIGVVSNGTDTLTVKLAKDLTGLNSVTIGTPSLDGSTAVTNISSGGVTVTNGFNKPVQLTPKGLDNGGNRITNVAPGIAPSDAVNVSQLQDMNRKTERDSIIGDSLNAALSALKPLQYDPLEPTQIMAGVGYYRGQGAFAIGVAHYQNESFMYNVGLSFGNSDNVMLNAGVTWKFGDSKKERKLAEEYRQGPISSAYVLESEVSKLREENKTIRDENKDMHAENQDLKDRMKKQEETLQDAMQQIQELKAMIQQMKK